MSDARYAYHEAGHAVAAAVLGARHSCSDRLIPSVAGPTQENKAGLNGVRHPASGVAGGIAKGRRGFQFAVGRHRALFQPEDDGQEYGGESNRPEEEL